MLEVEKKKAAIRKEGESALLRESREYEEKRDAKKEAAKAVENDKQRAHELTILHMLACAMAGQAPPPLARPPVTPTPAVPSAPATEDTAGETE
ncbi:hypothetical protein CYMTET_11416 [Cymbomonas tetramitiformis]|uniref:Uncharacterized protein n=1 Tax=Cymbomonas tetramitiformis TaxID=36881 RepID=A0AAE0GNR5_9CHLO|nr:hypothetical protein CYMTET_11416 [Cymbomonas tetramitiformis]